MSKQWPPTDEWISIYNKYAEYGAWYSGSRKKLMDYYAIKPDPFSGAGEFWGQNIPAGESRTMVHIPAAGDIAGTSAALILGAHPQFKIEEAHEEGASTEAKEAQERFTEITREMRLHSRLVEAAEVAAAFGGVFLKVNWDTEFRDYPIISAVHPDHAIPEWQWGYLTRVTFHRVIQAEHRKVYRHLEIHENGVIYNRLYKGDEEELGDSIPLAVHPETQDLKEEIQTGLKGLACVYIANTKPNRLWRGSELGRSDYHALTDLFDSLDSIYSDWMREIDIARGRILAPESYLKNERGSWIFDMDQTVFSPLEIAPTGDQTIEAIQFDIRAKEYQATATEIFNRIITTAGYALQSFGVQQEGRIESGAALKLRKEKSELTREMKQNYFKQGVHNLLDILIKIDQIYFGGLRDVTPQIELDDMTEIDIASTAKAIKDLELASAMSIETKVRMLHPEWNEDTIKGEIERIQAEQGVAVMNPEGRQD